MANIQFKALPSNSPSLFPENIFDRIPLNHPVRLVNQVVDQLDLDHIIRLYKGEALLVSIPGCSSKCCSTPI